MPRRIFARKHRLLRGLNPAAQLVSIWVVGKPVVYICVNIRRQNRRLRAVVCVLMYFMYKSIYYYNIKTPLPDRGVMVEKKHDRNPKDSKHTHTHTHTHTWCRIIFSCYYIAKANASICCILYTIGMAII